MEIEFFGQKIGFCHSVASCDVFEKYVDVASSNGLECSC